VKKFAATILAILYLVTSTGATIHMHYCMGQLKSSGLWHTAKMKDACPTCGMTKKKGCCEDKHTVLKVGKQYDLQPSAVSATKFVAEPARHNFMNYSPAFFTASLADYPLANSPPGVPTVPLYMAHCVYRI